MPRRKCAYPCHPERLRASLSRFAGVSEAGARRRNPERSEGSFLGDRGRVEGPREFFFCHAASGSSLACICSLSCCLQTVKSKASRSSVEFPVTAWIEENFPGVLRLYLASASRSRGAAQDDRGRISRSYFAELKLTHYPCPPPFPVMRNLGTIKSFHLQKGGSCPDGSQSLQEFHRR